MKVKNNTDRLFWFDSVKLAPGETQDIPDAFAPVLRPGLEVVAPEQKQVKSQSKFQDKLADDTY